MAKIRNPLLSLAASGTFGKFLTFIQRSAISTVRIQRPPTQRHSAAQEEQREAFRAGLALWAQLPTEEQEYWMEIAETGSAVIP